MKVCTDACLLGGYVAARLAEGGNSVQSILDIGGGTGLLSLMLAQKSGATIDTLEIDHGAAKQASQNFDASPWSGRLNTIHTDALAFRTHKKYDFIISNPPFFEDDLLSSDKKKNAAKHDTSLSLKNLPGIVAEHLAPEGSFGVLLPYHRLSYFVDAAAAYKLFLNEKLMVQHTTAHPFFRVILIFSNMEKAAVQNELAIKEPGGQYTRAFTKLLQDYYLYL
jgi:tRNA1Val (adenine37-N6)-methyltransferase